MTRAWYRLRSWWHRVLYCGEFVPGDDHILVACGCGGHARIKRNDDGTACLYDVTCPAWSWCIRAMGITPICEVPAARALPAKGRR